jgi:hypothetical protein
LKLFHPTINGMPRSAQPQSFAQWGSLSYTWAPKGQQPEVLTSGKRKAYQVFGLIIWNTDGNSSI